MSERKGRWQNVSPGGSRGGGGGGRGRRRNGHNRQTNFGHNGRGGGGGCDLKPNQFQGQMGNWPKSHNPQSYGQMQQQQQQRPHQRYEHFSQFPPNSWQFGDNGNGNQFNQRPANSNHNQFSSSNNQLSHMPITECQPSSSCKAGSGRLPPNEGVSIHPTITNPAITSPPPVTPEVSKVSALPAIEEEMAALTKHKETERQSKDVHVDHGVIMESSVEQEQSLAKHTEEEEKPPEPQKIRKKKRKSAKEKVNVVLPAEEEEDVVHIANVEPRIDLVVDEEVEKNREEEVPCCPTTTNDKTKSSCCILCDKEGHTSMECQMICKNCSGQYHGYRNCPKPVNLGTMMHLFLEFLTQNFVQLLSESQRQERSSSGLMEWLRQFPGLNLNTTISNTIQEEEPEADPTNVNMMGTGKSSLKSEYEKRKTTSESRRTAKSPSQQTPSKRKRGNSRNQETTLDEQTDIPDDSNSNYDDSSDEGKPAKHRKRNERNASSAIQGNGLNLGLLGSMFNQNKQQQSGGNQQQLDNSTAINLLLGQLLQNAIRGNNS